MKNVKLKLAILAALGAVTQVSAGTFESLPSAGFPVTTCGAGTHQPTCGTTAYKICNPTGNYGSASSTKTPVAPNDTCYLTPAPASDLGVPPGATGFAIVTSANRPVTLNNIYSNNTNISIGNVLDVVWRKPAATAPVTPTDECIYGTKFTASGGAANEYNKTVTGAGNQYFEANGIARGGFVDTSTSTARPVSIAYTRTSATSEVLFRAGRTFTSVQHRGSGATFGPGYYDLPLTTPAYTLSVNGVDAMPLTAVPAAGEQSASLNDNWVEFTTDANARDDDGSTTAASAMFYVKTTCSSAAPVATADAIRLRQSFQEQSTDGANPPADQRFIEVRVTGFVPPNGAANPTPTQPY